MRIPAGLSTALAAAALLLFSGAPAGAVNITMITFDEVADGYVHGSIVSSNNGVTFNVINPNNGADADIAVIFDTEQQSDPNDGDLLRFGTGPDQNAGAWAAGDLAPNTVLNNALIIQENATGCGISPCADPDDEMDGGMIEMIFAMPFFSFGIDVLDIDDGEDGGGLTFFDGGLEVFFSWGSLIQASDLGNNSANTIESININQADLKAAGFDGIDKVKVTFAGSGAIDNLKLDEDFKIAPEPGSALLLGLGMTGLAFAGRRRPTR